MTVRRSGAIGAAVAAIAALTMAGCGGGSGHSASSNSRTTGAALLDTSGVCGIEMLEEAGLISTGDQGTLDLITAIGRQSAQFELAIGFTGNFNTVIQQDGISAAIPQLTSEARSRCSQVGDPILTRGQFASLVQLVPPDNAAAMQGIDKFAEQPVAASSSAAFQPSQPADPGFVSPIDSPPATTDSSAIGNGYIVIFANVPETATDAEGQIDHDAAALDQKLGLSTPTPDLHVGKTDDVVGLRPGYWVVYEGFDSLTSAQQALPHLRAQSGVGDAYVRCVGNACG